ncbi:acyl-CoA thioesterase [Cellvibrio japonicus]|uniref:4-hydroxybenzoyl-CoA thioesterase domain protein n=1 Tax=Cellvibrio japonicus (strain Ueda107) TaxID=498211 RepID=B3PFJ5_CELJU|nr:acyl-CoA thioesterase [Cellvibrio japonicus]ACE82785.1 4-hydroxybenzoyl-CoA thioesterase domain protein [Cellvibrio japonicus Ueda107]QEI10860.1 acyl-CoA thioesterase [Cellvibrio japonicus]QEI14436.1 acyl-CoA thioesterase [Cellvibrio japonicus]QEI18014.1 acyl-CoA thioesterase [Cellvibrio japonicus]
MYTTYTDILVPFHDVDSMQVAWHGHYVKYLEVARCEFLESFNYSYQAMLESGYAWPVVDMRIKYIKPLRFGQRVRVQCALREWEYRLKIDYVISDAATGERLTKAYTIQVAVDLATQAMCFESPLVLRESLTRKLGHLPG